MAQWHCHIGGKSYGPVEAQQIRQWVQEQRMQPTDNVWCEGMAAWQPANAVPGLLAPAAGESPADVPPLPGQTPSDSTQAPVSAQFLQPHRGTAVLVLGILGVLSIGCFCPVFGIIAWVMGSTDLREMAAGRMDPAGRGNTSAGKICGMIGTILCILNLAGSVLWGIFVAMSAGHHSWPPR